MGFPLPDTGSVTEDVGVVGGLLTTSGDADLGPFFNFGNAWTPATIAGAYGSQLVIDNEGVWTYTADNSNPTIQALNTGESITEVFTINSVTGNTTVTITINGTDEPPCFVEGTPIDTPFGPRAIETLEAGDEVLTRDGGVQTIRWLGSSRINVGAGKTREKLQPIRICKDAFGPGVPTQDILLSPLHKVLLQGADVALQTGHEEVLCPVKHLCNGQTILREACEDVHYVHLMFDDHQIVTSGGLESESFFPGHVGLGGFCEDTREEMFDIFPELRSLPDSYGQTARQVLRGFEGVVYSASHRASPVPTYAM